MPAEAEEAPADTMPPRPRMEGWVQYYEYFYTLDADMQVARAPYLPRVRGTPLARA